MMNIAAWKDANDDVSASETTTTTRLEQDKEEAVIVRATTNGKTVNKKPPSNSSSSSSAWMRSKDPRIVRVSRAFGGKDRHSKVSTLRGLRDRRVRLSVPTAIQLYDLQERLGVDQPSKAVDWLLNAAKDEIDELPPLPVSPEHFSLLHNHNHHHQPGQDPTQFGFKINTSVEECHENKERRENDAVLSNNGDYNSYNLEHHHQNSCFQTDYHHHLVPFPTTIQSLFPSSSSSSRTDGSRTGNTMDLRETINHFQMPLMGNNNSSSSSSHQNISSLYSLLHGSGNSSNSNSRMFSSSVQFNGGNTMSRFVGSDSSTSRGSDDQQM